MKTKYTYYAFFTPDEEMPNAINITFPGVPGCLSCAFSEEQAMKFATEALSLILDSTDVEHVPRPLELWELPDHSIKTTVHPITVTMCVENGKLVSDGK